MSIAECHVNVCESWVIHLFSQSFRYSFIQLFIHSFFGYNNVHVEIEICGVHSWQKSTRCRVSIKVMLYQSYLTWLVLRIPSLRVLVFTLKTSLWLLLYTTLQFARVYSKTAMVIFKSNLLNKLLCFYSLSWHAVVHHM